MFESQQLDKLRTAECLLRDVEAVMRTHPEIGNDTDISWTWSRISDVSTQIGVLIEEADEYE